MRLIANHLPDELSPVNADQALFNQALHRTENCFSHIRRRYYAEGVDTLFDHLNGDHMASFLYFYGNTVWRETGDADLPTRLFYVNKIMHGLDLFYSVNMPDVFMLVHPVGTVLGNATYGDYLVVYQNCTVGASKNVYPSFGTGTILYSRSSVIGNCRLGDDVVMAANAMLIDSDVPNSVVVTGQYPLHRMSTNTQTVRSRCFD
jgi:serine O-acetyltransferase